MRWRSTSNLSMLLVASLTSSLDTALCILPVPQASARGNRYERPLSYSTCYRWCFSLDSLRLPSTGVLTGRSWSALASGKIMTTRLPNGIVVGSPRKKYTCNNVEGWKRSAGRWDLFARVSDSGTLRCTQRDVEGEQVLHGAPGSSSPRENDESRQAFSAAAVGGIGMGSTEFVNLVKAQFDVLSTMLGASQIVLFVRRENTETGALEFVPAMVHPEKARVWIMDANGIQVQEGPKELPWTESAADVLPNYPFISVRKRGDEWETPDAVENDDGGLSAPLMYASVVLGMITVWKRDKNASGDMASREQSVRSSEATGDVTLNAPTIWTAQDKDVLEKISSSVAMAAVLDQKKRWAAVVHVGQLRRVLAESLHQVKNPITALRTFGKLLLRRLPRDDTLNRELAKDIMLQSDRLVDLLLPVDNVIGLLEEAADDVHDEVGRSMIARAYPQIEGSPSADVVNEDTRKVVSDIQEPLAADFGEDPEGVQDALLSPQPVRDDEDFESTTATTPATLKALPTPETMRLLFAQDVIEPVVRAAQAVAQTRRVCFRWRIDDDLPGIFGDERALEEALSNVVDNALKYSKMGYARDGGGGRPTVVLLARPSTDEEWGRDSGVVIEIVDNGPGVDLDDLPFIFDPGFRGRQPRESKIAGTGLGLGIAREIMRSMGGDLEVSNKPDDGWGTEVKLFLPRRRRESRL